VPTYTYACRDCDEQLEVVQSFTADPLTDCPRCGGRLRKVFHPVGVVFKGSGFYRNDSRSSTKGPAGGSGGGTEGSGSARTQTSGSGDTDTGTSGTGGDAKKSSTPSTTPSTGSGTSASGSSAGSSGAGASGGTSS